VKYWNNYWSLNTKGDCFSLDGKSDLSLIMSKFWDEYFLKKGNNAYVLDLACGNGFVGKSAIRNGRNLYCIGVDQSSDLGQTHYENKDTKSFLRLLPNMSVDNLKFVDNEFDFIVSQFGFEYSPNYYNVLANCLRQLKPNGELRLLIHKQSSVIFEHSSNELVILKFLLGEYNIFNKMRNKTLLSDVRNTITDKCNSLILDSADITTSILVNIYTFLDALLEGKGVDSSRINELEVMYTQQKERLEEQIKVSKNEDGVQNLTDSLKELSFRGVEANIFESAEFGVVGWLVEAQK
jgi:ubiquinone/menaquinone biosynthesis C-methylase UbiE